MRRSVRIPRASTCSQAPRRVAALASGSASVTWSSVRSAMSGVRSSCDALATKCRCAWNDASGLANRSFSVSPSLVNSSSRRPSRSRRLKLLAEMSRAAAVIARTGLSSRLASSHPNATDNITSTARLATISGIGPNAWANGCLTTTGAAEPTCCVELTVKKATDSTSKPVSRNAPE